MMDNKKLKKGGIDTIVAYIVVIIPLVYIVAFIIAIIYHFSIQGYIAQVAKELAISASTHGEITDAMMDRVNNRLDALDVGEFEIAIIKREYNEVNNTFGNKVNLTGSASDPYVSTTSVPELTVDGAHPDFKQKDTIAIYLKSDSLSLLATVANFGLFGSGGTSELSYSTYREEIVRYAP